jgi:hypothetical protein
MRVISSNEGLGATSLSFFFSAGFRPRADSLLANQGQDC